MIDLAIQPYDDIQNYLDILYANGGGTCTLETGTHTLTQDLIILSGVTLKGASRDNCIIECGDFSVRMEGTDVYNTGDVSITNGSTTVTGSGTTFDVSMVGRHIWLQDSWYEIATFTSDTELELIDIYTGTTLTNETDYVISQINLLPQLQTITVQNSTGSGVVCNYCRENLLSNINIYNCIVGLEMNYCIYPKMLLSSDYNEVGAVWNNVYGYNIDFCEFSYSTVGVGLVMTKCGKSNLYSSSFANNATNGITMTNCSSNPIDSCDLSNNGANGIELISNCNTNSFSSGTSFDNNGAYGIKINNANCSDNILTGVIALGNISGSLDDSGTGTLKSLTVNKL